MRCKDGSDTLRENLHFRGHCCGEEQLPIRLTYLRHEPSEVVQNCTFNLMLMAGSMSPGVDSKYSPAQQYQVKRFFNESDAQQTVS